MYEEKIREGVVYVAHDQGRAMADLVVSGEVALSASIFRDHAIEVKGKGAPVEWVPMDVVPTNTGGMALMAQAPHPYAAALMADFILSPEGAKILADLEYGSPLKQTGYKLWYPGGRNVDGPVR